MTVSGTKIVMAPCTSSPSQTFIYHLEQVTFSSASNFSANTTTVATSAIKNAAVFTTI